MRRPQIKKFYKTNPPKNGNSDSKYDFIVMKRGPKAPNRARWAPQPSAGARRRGAEHPELLVSNIFPYFPIHIKTYFSMMYQE